MNMNIQNEQLELRLGESLIRYQLKNPFSKLKKGMSLVLDAGYFIMDKKYVHALEPLFEGLGWIYLSGMTDVEAYRSSVALAGTYLQLLSKCKEVVGWRMSMDQIECYGEIAGLTLDSGGVEAAHAILKRVAIASRWSTLRRYSE